MHRTSVIVAFVIIGCGSSDPAADTDASSGDTTSATMSTTNGDPSTAPTGTTEPTTEPSTTDPSSTMTASTSLDTTASSGGTDDTTGDPPLPRDAVAVAVGYGTRRVRSEDGLAWTDFVEVDPNGGDDDNLLRGVGYGDGVFVAVGGAGIGLTLRSPDGITWTPVSNDLTSFLSDVAWQDDVFVAAGGNGLRVRSVDGVNTWQDETPYFSGHYRAIAAGNGVFVAVGHTYGDQNIGLSSTSTDGATWTTEQTFGAPISGGSIAFGDGVFVVRDGSGAMRTSEDGSAWSEPVAQREGEGRVIHADGAFVTSGSDGFWTSGDGETWESIGAGDGRSVDGWLDGRWLSLGWPLAIDASEDLQGWQNAFSVDGPGLTDIAVGSPGA